MSTFGLKIFFSFTRLQTLGLHMLQKLEQSVLNQLIQISGELQVRNDLGNTFPQTIYSKEILIVDNLQVIWTLNMWLLRS